jgi:hypothetical protein
VGVKSYDRFPIRSGGHLDTRLITKLRNLVRIIPELRTRYRCEEDAVIERMTGERLVSTSQVFRVVKQ